MSALKSAAIRVAVSAVVMTGLAASLGVRAHAGIAALAARSTSDWPDDLTGSQVHVIYALPQDGIDAQRDTNGGVAASVASGQAWLRGQNGEHGVRYDTTNGDLDVTFFRSSRSDRTLQGVGAFVTALYLQGAPAGYNSANKPFATTAGAPGDWQFAALQEVSCA